MGYMKKTLSLCSGVCALGLSLAAAGYEVRNPVINADCPDPSLCFDGTNYYMVTTTMHLFPGAPVMRSSDLRHWETVSYVFDRMDGESRYSLEDPEGMTAYGHGQWAASLKRHNGKFYCYFVCNGTGGFLYEADKGEGPWRLKSKPGFFHDASLLFDDDGRVYIFSGSGNIDELKSDLTGVREGGLCMRNVVDYGSNGEDALLEGSSAFKRDGWYYLMMISMKWGEGGHLRREVCYRSRTLDNPKWEYKVILETPFEEFGGVGQGCVVEGANGEWNAVIFQDRGGVGRVPCLMPVRWVDGWPMLGMEDGSIPNDGSKPFASVGGIVGSDDFSGDRLSLYWQWNHMPAGGAWSLAERRGWLRLTTPRVSKNLFLAPNTLTQRMVGPECSGVVRIDVSGMKDGDRGGIAAFNGDSAVLAVVMENGAKRLVMTEERSVFGKVGRQVAEVNVKECGSAPLKGDVVWMRVRANFEHGADWAELDWSENGTEWRRIGSRMKISFDYTRFFMGTKFALFNYATKEAGGHVDFDKFIFSCRDHETNKAVFRDFALTGEDEPVGKIENAAEVESRVKYVNPILAGMAPDPAITRKGKDYYLANSSFSYYPGIPIWHSTDLVNWDFCGYCASRPEQLRIGEGVGLSAGVFAPDIKYNPHNDTFYLIVTVIGDRGNVVYKTKDPWKGWSDPIKVPVGGIDPSFYFVDEKTAWILNNDDAPDGKAEYPGHRTVRMRKYDLLKDEVVPGTERIIINKGVNPAEKPIWCEGPHLYKIDGTYYVMTAEGGTAAGHTEVIWRSENIEGPYRPCPVNPILTQRGLKSGVPGYVTSAGHADLFQTPEGDWYAIFLAIIPYNEDGRDWCPTGRSTFLLPVKWIGEGESRQPIILEAGKRVPFVDARNAVEKDAFTSEMLDPMWFQIRTPQEKWYKATSEGLELKARPQSIYERGNPSCLLRWIKNNSFTAEVAVDFEPKTDDELAGLVLYQNETCNYVAGNTKCGVELSVHDKGGRRVLAQAPDVNAKKFRAVARRGAIRFYFSEDGERWQALGDSYDAKVLTTDYAGGFVGTAVGVYATSNLKR